MYRLTDLLDRNREWARRSVKEDPAFFQRLVDQQSPKFLWIGCSDSRVPANQIVDLLPGEMFVHRNIGNVVVHTDFNCLSVIQYAVEVLKVEHIIVCGHFGCGGVRAAMQNQPLGLIDNWLRNIRDVRQLHFEELSNLPAGDIQLNRLCELNVIQQVANVAHTSIVQAAWRNGQKLALHGWIYSLENGEITSLQEGIRSPEEISDSYRLGD